MKIIKYMLLVMFLLPTTQGFATIIVPGGFHGTWNCNLDGRPAEIEFYSKDRRVCHGSICSVIVAADLVGRVSDNGGPWKYLRTRKLNGNDPRTKNKSHIQAFTFDNKEPWLLMLNTWRDRNDYANYLTGYSTWHGTIFPIQCQRESL